MAYRDDLEAAMARIAALEEELEVARASGDAHAGLRERNQLLESELARANAELTRARVDLTQARSELAAPCEKLYGSPPDATAELPTLPQRNRKSPRRLPGVAMGAVCPACLEIGNRVEMVRPEPDVLAAPAGLIAVVCPACASLGLLRE